MAHIKIKYWIFVLLAFLLSGCISLSIGGCATQKKDCRALNGGVEIYELGGKEDSQIIELQKRAERKARVMNALGSK